MKDNPSYEEIISQRLAQLRFMTAMAFRAGEPGQKYFRGIVESLEVLVAETMPENLELFREQKTAALTANFNWEVSGELQLGRPELQLLWGAALAMQIMRAQGQNENFKPQESKLWQQIASHEILEEERRFCAQVMSAIPGLRERQGTLSVEWTAPEKGYPGISYDCDIRNGAIRLDLPWAMIMGIEPARSIMLRTAAHSLGTLFFTPKMQQVRREMSVIKAKASRSPEEHSQMIRLAAQWLTRYDLLIASESNYAGGFIAALGREQAQDYAASLNYAEAVIGDIDQSAARLASLKPDAKTKKMNLERAIRYVFFCDNGLFADNIAGWRSVGVEPDLIETADGKKRGMAAVKELQEMCRALRLQQPDMHDRMNGAAYYTQKLEEFSAIRSEMADRIFDRFASHLMLELEQDAEENPDETLDRMDKMTDEGKDEDKAEGKDKKEGNDDTADVDGEGKKRDAKLPPEKPKDGEGEPGEGEGEPGEGEPGEGEGEPGGGEGEPGEGEGEPGDEEGEGESGGDSDADGELEDDTAKDIKDEKESEAGGGGNGPGDTSSDEDPEADDGSYSEYLKIIEPHREAIRRAAALMKKIQEKLTIRIQDPPIGSSLVPEDGDVSRFQPDRLQDRLVKQFSGQSIDESDFETFRVDGPIRSIPARTEIQIWIDGSGSMQGAPVETAITTGCILYEAAREAGMDVHISMLGDPVPLLIASPGMTDKEVGRLIQGVRQGQGGNKDYLAPSIELMIKNTLEQKNNASGPVGNTHAFVVTDGGFTDGDFAMDAIRAVNDNCPHVTLDFVLIGHQNMHLNVRSLADELNKKAKRTPIGTKPLANIEQIHDGVMAMLTERMKNVRAGDAIPLRQKQKEFKNVKLKNNPRRG